MENTPKVIWSILVAIAFGRIIWAILNAVSGNYVVVNGYFALTVIFAVIFTLWYWRAEKPN